MGDKNENPDQIELAQSQLESDSQAPLLEFPRENSIFVDNVNSFRKAIDQLLSGSGEIAVDTERASGFTYWPKAYLVQIYRRGGGLFLIDPVAFSAPELWRELNEKTQNEIWIIHAATQDLPSLQELGIKPNKVFDTELGARIAGLPRVSLGALTESLLGFRLAKEHSAVNWSNRPLLEQWLNYAALDVDVLIDLKIEVENILAQAGKLDWAEAEFANILKNQNSTNNKEKKSDPWRKTSGMHKIRNPRALTTLRELWLVRDELAKEYDLAPGRLLPDDLLIEFSIKDFNLEKFTELLNKRSRFSNPSSSNKNLPISISKKFYQSYLESKEIPESELPPLRVSSDELPPPKLWKEKNRLAYARFSHARAVMLELSSELNIPVENLLSPKILRDLVWEEPPADKNNYETYTQNKLRELGARDWQRNLVTEKISAILGETTELKKEEVEIENTEVSDLQS